MISLSCHLEILLVLGQCCCFEAKNEAGMGGCDPLIQGSLTYGQWCATQRECNWWSCTCFSAFIVTLIGPSLSIYYYYYGAVYLDHVHVNHLVKTVLTLSQSDQSSMYFQSLEGCM